MNAAQRAAARATEANARATLAVLPIPETGPVIVTLTLDQPGQLPPEVIDAITAELERLAPGRCHLALLGPDATIAVLSDADLDSLGLCRHPPPQQLHGDIRDGAPPWA